MLGLVPGQINWEIEGEGLTLARRSVRRCARGPNTFFLVA